MRIATKPILIFALALVLLQAIAGLAVAQDGGEEGEDGRPFEHPVVALLASYFGVEAEQVVTLQKDGIGLGVQVKLYAIAAESGVSVETLIAELEAGGMGQLYKKYGKPATLGVGHVRKDSQTGPPPHAGPKEGAGGEDGEGPPPHAGPKDKDGKGPPPHAGPKKNGGEGGE